MAVSSHPCNHWCNEHELGQTLGDGEGQESLACCSPWGFEELDMTWRLNSNMESRKSGIDAIICRG